VEVLLITSRDTRRWVIPRGGRKGREPPSKAAAREAFEEAGVTGKVRRTPIGVYEFDKRLKSGRLQPTLVTVYPLALKRELRTWPEKRERERLWIDPLGAAERVEEPALQALLARFNPEAA
jgi:8-oxo-dGTP pyrophosphatase MutT (NUDIX family)